MNSRIRTRSRPPQISVWSGHKLLYVEDEAVARKTLSRMIAKKYPDFRLFIAENGVAGLELFKKQQPDIVLTDMEMPFMDGIQMASEIKALATETVIIAITAHNDPKYLQNALEIGIRHYVLKPISGEYLFTVIENTLEELKLKHLISEQQRQILLREQQLARAQKITHLGSWEWSLVSGKTNWSDELYRILAIDPATTPASFKGFLERVHPEDRTAVIKSVRNALKKCQSIAGYYCRIVRPDGSIRTLHGQGDVLLNDNGKLVSVLGTAHDVTERRQMEEERARMAMIVESSNDAIFSISLDGLITSWNRGAKKIFGYADEEIIGRQILILIPPERYDERSRLLQSILAGEEVKDFETTRITKDGRQIHVSITTSSILAADGKIIGNSVIARDVTERRKLEEIIKHQAYHDTLTDLPNRQLFMDFLSLELAQARRNEKKLALLFMDLNGFKLVNDTLGHSCGDRLLQEVAQRLKGCIRESDTVARLGGDEFTVMMPDLAQTDDVGIVLKKILNVFRSPFKLDEVSVDTTTSIGICMFPDDGDSSDELMKKADIAMYDAKNSGKNSYQFYNAEINSRTIKRQKVEGFLQQAVGRGELELLFQPMLCSDTHTIIGAEALLRWRHPEQGLLSPDQFLKVAEDSGVIVPIGEWVIRQACDQAKRWNEKGYPLSVSVNLSNRQFHQANFIEKTARILAETGLQPHHLEFDLTEKTIMADTDFSLRSMQALAEMGVTIAIDNFGRGSSSLHWLKRLQTHKVKIDKSFVQNMLSEPDDMSVVNAVIAMSHNLQMKVVANGIETAEQLSFVQRSGCDELQGYMISEPLLPTDFERFMVNF